MTRIHVVESVLKANEAVAQDNRRRMDAAGVVAVNIMSAPGSGKTTLLEQTIPALAAQQQRCAVLVGDLQTTRDAERLGASAAEITQINTGRGCHLSASQVHAGLDTLKLERIDFLFIENVGNMVCPAAHDLGEHVRAVLLSVPEGDDKVAKYPTLFQPADVVLLTKVDLIGILDYAKQKVYEDLSRINSRASVIECSPKTGQGLENWLGWLAEQRGQRARATPDQRG